MTNRQPTTAVEVTGLFVYPVKSCRGISLGQAVLTSQGFRHDRQWVIVAENGRALTQRDNPLMAQIETQLDGEQLHLSRAGHGSVSVPIEAAGTASSDDIITIKIWKDECRTVSAGDEASQWLGEALETDKSLRLVRMADGHERPQSMSEELGAETRIQFADAAPYLFIDEASLQKLNEVLAQKGESAVPINRFRPNVVISGLEAFAEHEQNALGNDKYRFDFRIPCERCVIPTIDQQTAVPHPRKEPFATLREINPRESKRRQPLFGQYATLQSGAGTLISVGDRLSA